MSQGFDEAVAGIRPRLQAAGAAVKTQSKWFA
jgi:hypothetical protein